MVVKSHHDSATSFSSTVFVVARCADADEKIDSGTTSEYQQREAIALLLSIERSSNGSDYV